METAAATGLRRVARPPLPEGPYLVAGIGRAGQGAVGLLARVAGPTAVRAWDSATHATVRRIAERIARLGVDCTLGGDGTQALADVRCLIKSPGIPLEAPVVVEAQRCGVHVIDELELAWHCSSLPMVGVTGTKGKSTVTTLAGSVCRVAAGAAHLAGNTDFAPAWSAVTAAEGIAVCEVSSQQIEGCRNLLPDVGVFTNIHPEANRHGSPEATAAIKRQLFVRGERCVPFAVVNGDDPYGREIARGVAERGGRVVTYGEGADVEYRVRHVEWSLSGSAIDIEVRGEPIQVESRAPGPKNAVNVAAALAVGEAVGLGAREAVGAIAATPPPPGRYECVDLGQPFDAVVDMAHTPESIRECLSTLREVVARRPGASLRTIYCVIGSTAMREPRAASGRVARELSDELILTGGALRGEPPLVNLAFALEGARAAEGGELKTVLDRRKAIRATVRAARPGDVIVAIGRGPIEELSVDARGGMLHRSDAQMLAEAIRDLRAI